MSALAQLEQQIVTIGTNTNFVFTRVHYNASGDTVKVPTGSAVAACLAVVDGTVPTATITAGATEDSVALTSGTVGKQYWLITRHTGGVITR